MPYTMEDYRRDVLRRHLDQLPPDERLKGLSTDERLKGLSTEEIRAYLEKREKQGEP